MNQPDTIRLDAELLAALRAAAEWRGMTVDAYAHQVLTTASQMDAELAAFVQEGIDAADRGEFVSQEEMEAWFEAQSLPAAAE